MLSKHGQENATMYKPSFPLYLQRPGWTWPSDSRMRAGQADLMTWVSKRASHHCVR